MNYTTTTISVDEMTKRQTQRSESKRGWALEMRQPRNSNNMIHNNKESESNQADRLAQQASNEVPPTKLQRVGGALPSSTSQSDRPKSVHAEVEALKGQCSLPVLMKMLGLGAHAKRSCRSPFRDDRSASWGIFQRDGRWYWKDHGTDESGDEVDFIRTLKGWKDPGGFTKALEYYRGVVQGMPVEAVPPIPVHPAAPRQKPDSTGFGPGTRVQLQCLSKLRNIDLAALQVAQDRGFLIFGRFAGHQVYGITDVSGHVVEVRRLDGLPFPAHGELGERKSHALKGSRKDWPVGIAGIENRPMILLVEGLPDFLAAFEVMMSESAEARVAPVAMLSASTRIGDDAVALLAGRHVRIVPHNDNAGRTAAFKWAAQVHGVGASKVDFLHVWNEPGTDACIADDLNEFLPIYRARLIANSQDRGAVL